MCSRCAQGPNAQPRGSRTPNPRGAVGPSRMPTNTCAGTNPADLKGVADRAQCMLALTYPLLTLQRLPTSLVSIISMPRYRRKHWVMSGPSIDLLLMVHDQPHAGDQASRAPLSATAQTDPGPGRQVGVDGTGRQCSHCVQCQPIRRRPRRTSRVSLVNAQQHSE